MAARSAPDRGAAWTIRLRVIRNSAKKGSYMKKLTRKDNCICCGIGHRPDLIWVRIIGPLYPQKLWAFIPVCERCLKGILGSDASAATRAVMLGEALARAVITGTPYITQ